MKIPWTYQIDGPDLVVRNITATCFGGKYDKGDDGQTESGVMNDGRYDLLYCCALPIRSAEVATRDSPLAFKGPHIPWFTEVRVWRETQGEDFAFRLLLLDNGPKVSEYPTHALDINDKAVLKHLAPHYDPMKVANEWGESGISYRIIDGARWIS